MEIIPFLDRHLVYPILDFLQDHNEFPEKDILHAKFDLLEDTNMPGHCAELYKEIHGVEEAPERFEAKSIKIEAELATLEQSSQSIMQVLENPEVASALRQDKSQNQAFLKDTHGISVEQINVLYRLGQFEYNRGNYTGASEHLYHFRVLSTDHKLVTSATWGKFASEILTANWEESQSELTKLREYIDADSSDGPSQLKNRTWLLHWSLFPMHKSGTSKAAELQDLFFSSAYLNAIQTKAPHLLRYLTSAVLTTAAGKLTQQAQLRRCRDLARLLSAETEYTDPFVAFAKCAFVTFDLGQASSILAQAKDAASADYFLNHIASDLLRAMQIIMIETYLRLHRNSNIDTLSRLVSLSQAELTQILQEDLGHLNVDVDEEDGVVEFVRRVSANPLQEMIHKIVERSQGAQMQSRLGALRV